MTTPRTTQLHPWEWTTKKWCQLHVNFAGRFQGKTFLKVADAQSKWLKVFLMNSMSSSAVVNTLRLIFATHGLAGVTVSDNGTSFTSAEFQELAKCNGIHCPCPCPITLVQMTKPNVWSKPPKRLCSVSLKVIGQTHHLHVDQLWGMAKGKWSALI